MAYGAAASLRPRPRAERAVMRNAHLQAYVASSFGIDQHAVLCCPKIQHHSPAYFCLLIQHAGARGMAYIL